MGYDDGECVECRFIYSGGNVPTDNRADVCLACIQHMSFDSAAADGRLVNVLKERFCYGRTSCGRCGAECTLYVDISICASHLDCNDSE